MDTMDTLKNDLAILNSMTPDQQNKLLDLVLGFLSEPHHSDFQKGLSVFADSLQTNSTELKVVVRALIIFLQKAMKEGVSKDQLGENCLTLGLSEVSTASVIDSWCKHGKSIATTLVSRTVAANQLIDLDWTFGVTAASDDMDQVGKTFIQLKLTVNDGGDSKKFIFMELSLEQVGNLSNAINSLTCIYH